MYINECFYFMKMSEIMKDNAYYEGLIKIDDDVLEMIVTLQTLETKGVAGMSSTFGDGVVSLLGLKNEVEGVKVQRLDDGRIDVSVYVVVQYGYRIPDIALRLQERVKTALVEMAEVDVAGVDIYIQSIVFDAPPINQ